MHFVIPVLLGLLIPALVTCDLCTGAASENKRGIECRQGGLKPVDCASTFKKGVKVVYRCKAFYVPVKFKGNDWREVTCLGSDVWEGYYDFENFACEPEYGRLGHVEAEYFNGISPIVPVPLISNGQETDTKSFPWHASLYYRGNINTSYICGGTLIRTNIVLTAAHCTYSTSSLKKDDHISFNPKDIIILLAAVSGVYEENFSARNSRIQYLQEFSAEQIIRYGDKIKGDDIALIKLDKEAELTEYVRPAKLPTPRFDPDGEVLFMQINGFGVTGNDSNGQPSSTFFGAKVTTDSKKECEKYKDYFVPSKEMCISTVNAGDFKVQGICEGDSGGGSFYEDDKVAHSWTMQGVVSRGFGESTVRCFSILIVARVHSYLDWIHTQVRILQKSGQKVTTTTTTITTTPRTTSTTRISAVSSAVAYPSRQQPKTTQAPPVYPGPIRTTPNGQSYVVPLFIPPPRIQIPDYVTFGIQLQNSYRESHAAPQLEYSDALQQEAQNHASFIASNNYSLVLKGDTAYGQNLYEYWGRSLSSEAVVQKAVESWYNDKVNYNFNYPSVSMFSQLVWRSSRFCGIGLATAGDRTVVVAMYSPRGNLNGQFSDNVTPPKTISTSSKKEQPSFSESTLAPSAQTFASVAKPVDQESSKDELVELAVSLHNKYRKAHRAPDLRADSELTTEAQRYADLVVRGNFDLQAKAGVSYGQNVFEYDGYTTISSEEAVTRGVKSWYDGISDYDWNSPLKSKSRGFTFSQVVWKSSTRLGIGVGFRGRRTVVIAFYSPPGNIAHEQSYRNNVFSLVSPNPSSHFHSTSPRNG